MVAVCPELEHCYLLRTSNLKIRTQWLPSHMLCPVGFLLGLVCSVSVYVIGQDSNLDLQSRCHFGSMSYWLRRKLEV